MQKKRLFGLWLIAAYFGIKGAVLAFLVIQGHLDPSRTDQCISTMEKLVPFLSRIRDNASLSLAAGAFFSVFGFVICFGVLVRHIYAIAYILTFHGLALLQFLGAKAIFSWIGWNDVGPNLSSLSVKIQLVASLLMVLYLLSPPVFSELARSANTKD
jgi:hypothetical protein